MIEQYDRKRIPFFMAGGISSENVGDLIRRFHPYAVDVSGSVESQGKKDREKILEFVKSVRNAEGEGR